MGDPLTPALRERLFGEACAASSVRALSRALTSLYDDALRPLDMTVAQMNLLTVLLEHPDARPSELAAWIHADRSTLTRNLELLRRHGWIEVRGVDDGRSRSVRLSRDGRRVLARAVERWEAAQAATRRWLGEDAIPLLAELAGRLERTGGAPGRESAPDAGFGRLADPRRPVYDANPHSSAPARPQGGS